MRNGTYDEQHIVPIPVEQVYLDLVNPRHEELDTQEEVIEYLVKDEYVLQLAKDIAKHGLSPLEAFAVVEKKDPSQKKKKTTARKIIYTVAEGNRRLCAVKLLHDPDLAPASKRKEFEKLAENADYIPSVIYASVFDDMEKLKIWIERLHAGLQGGIGRSQWDASQKARNTGVKKNALALAILDVAENKGYISPSDRKGKITTVQRYLTNNTMKEVMGIDTSNPDGVASTRPQKDIDLLLQRFIIDLLDGEVSSRKNKQDITAYAREISAMDGLSNKRVTAELIQDYGKHGKKKAQIRKKMIKLARIPYNEDIHDALSSIPSYKLESLYNSLTSIKFDHTPLLAVGLWVFMETLTALCGRVEKTDIQSFLNKQKLQDLGITAHTDMRTTRSIMQRIAEYGNTTKHHRTSAAFNGEQMANDVETITDIIIALAKAAR